MPTRRQTTLALAALLAARPGLAQSRAKSVVVGVLSYGGAQAASAIFEPFAEALRASGWTEGRNITLLARSAANDPAAARKAAEEFVAAKADLIVVSQTPALAAVLAATSAVPVPVVLLGVADPVGSGLVKSLARPGGNITGMSSTTPRISVKTLQILGEMLPGLRKVGVFINPDDSFSRTFRRYLEDGGRTLGLQVEVLPVGKGADLQAAVDEMIARRAQAVVVQPTVSRGIVRLALARNLPTAGPSTTMIVDGCLLAYGPELRQLAQQTANYVDRILRGAKPADLPVSEPSHFELVLNAGVARTLGITIPQSVLLQASRVVD
jgi:putative ABC transport system substrate-binding protein